MLCGHGRRQKLGDCGFFHRHRRRHSPHDAYVLLFPSHDLKAAQVVTLDALEELAQVPRVDRACRSDDGRAQLFDARFVAMAGLHQVRARQARLRKCGIDRAQKRGVLRARRIAGELSAVRGELGAEGLLRGRVGVKSLHERGEQYLERCTHRLIGLGPRPSNHFTSASACSSSAWAAADCSRVVASAICRLATAMPPRAAAIATLKFSWALLIGQHHSIGNPSNPMRTFGRYSWPRSSFDFSTWQSAHSPCRLSCVSVPPWCSGLMWSSSVASLSCGGLFAWQRTQNGWSLKCSRRIFCSARPRMRSGSRLMAHHDRLDFDLRDSLDGSGPWGESNKTDRLHRKPGSDHFFPVAKLDFLTKGPRWAVGAAEHLVRHAPGGEVVRESVFIRRLL